MKHIVQCAILLCAMLGGACQAAEATVCKSICTQERRECRGQAELLTQTDTDPLYAPRATNRDARAFAEVRVNALEKPGSDFQKRKMERYHACDDTSLRCSRACSSPPPAAEPASVVLKPKGKQ